MTSSAPSSLPSSIWLPAVEDAALGHAAGVDERLVVHVEQVVAVAFVIGERIAAGRLDAELGIAAEHDFDAPDAGLMCLGAAGHQSHAHERGAARQQLVSHPLLLLPP